MRKALELLEGISGFPRTGGGDPDTCLDYGFAGEVFPAFAGVFLAETGSTVQTGYYHYPSAPNSLHFSQISLIYKPRLIRYNTPRYVSQSGDIPQGGK